MASAGAEARSTNWCGGTGFPACAKAASQSRTAWKGCATSQCRLFRLYTKLTS